MNKKKERLIYLIENLDSEDIDLVLSIVEELFEINGSELEEDPLGKQEGIDEVVWGSAKWRPVKEKMSEYPAK